jgi:hypothetical protein
VLCPPARFVLETTLPHVFGSLYGKLFAAGHNNVWNCTITTQTCSTHDVLFNTELSLPYIDQVYLLREKNMESKLVSFAPNG